MFYKKNSRSAPLRTTTDPKHAKTMADQSATTDYRREHVAVKPPSSWKSYLWDTFDLPKEERWLLFKLDACVLTFSSVSKECAGVKIHINSLD